MQNLLNPSYKSPKLEVSFKIARILEQKAKFVFEDLKFLEIANCCSNTVELAHKINKYHVALLRDYLFNHDLLEGKKDVKRLLSVKYYKADGNPGLDKFVIKFLGIKFENPGLFTIDKLLEFINHYILTIDQGGLKGHVTFSVTLKQEAIDKLKTDSLNSYLGTFAYPDRGKKIVKPGKKGYLLNLGQIRQDDIETKYRFEYFKQVEAIIAPYNMFIVYLADYLPDYLIIDVA